MRGLAIHTDPRIAALSAVGRQASVLRQLGLSIILLRPAAPPMQFRYVAFA